MPRKLSSLGRDTKAARKKRISRASETREQRQARNEAHRLYSARSRALESDEHRRVRLEKNRLRSARKRASDSQKQKKLRLQKAVEDSQPLGSIGLYPRVVQCSVNDQCPPQASVDIGKIVKSHLKSIIYNQRDISQHEQSHQQSIINSLNPIHLGVNLKRLPFYDIIFDLLKPSFLIPSNDQGMQESNFYFCLTAQEAIKIANSTKHNDVKQVQMRFCLLNTTYEQEDSFPSRLMVKVNDNLIYLQNPHRKTKPAKIVPLNITNVVKLNPGVLNVISAAWEAETNREYAISVSLVRELTSKDLLMRIEQKGAQHSDVTRELIQEKLMDDDIEIAMTSLKVSLICPVSSMRMSTPCRPTTCSHLQCFDAHFFLQMNKNKSSWICPVCDKPASYDDLVIDGYFQEVLGSKMLQPDMNEIELHKDGTWSIQRNAENMEVSIDINDEVLD